MSNLYPTVEVSAPIFMHALSLYFMDTSSSLSADAQSAKRMLNDVTPTITINCHAYVDENLHPQPEDPNWVMNHIIQPNPHSALVHVYNTLFSHIQQQCAQSPSRIVANQVIALRDLDKSLLKIKDLTKCTQIILCALSIVDQFPRFNSENNQNAAMAEDVLEYLYNRLLYRYAVLYTNNTRIAIANMTDEPANHIGRYGKFLNVTYDIDTRLHINPDADPDSVVIVGSTSFCWEFQDTIDDDDGLKAKIDNIAKTYGYDRFEQVEPNVFVAKRGDEMRA